MPNATSTKSYNSNVFSDAGKKCIGNDSTDEKFLLMGEWELVNKENQQTRKIDVTKDTAKILHHSMLEKNIEPNRLAQEKANAVKFIPQNHVDAASILDCKEFHKAAPYFPHQSSRHATPTEISVLKNFGKIIRSKPKSTIQSKSSSLDECEILQTNNTDVVKLKEKLRDQKLELETKLKNFSNK